MSQVAQWTVLLAVLLGSPANAAEKTEPVNDSPAVASVAAYPADPDCTSPDCADVLHHPQSMVYVTRVPFPLGSALLSSEGEQELLQFLIELESYGVVESFSITGHADPGGPEQYNQWISEVRAERVAWFLRQSGVDPRTITTTGAGSRQPVVGAIDPAEHRRAEIEVTVRPFH